MPRGGPDGGNGGNGGNVFIVGDASLNTLLHLRYQVEFRAGHGRHGGGNNKQGGRGSDVRIAVPLGTVVRLVAENGRDDVADILDEQPVLVSKGGMGGRGNSRFATSTNQTPLLGESGERGEELKLRVELKLLADVGIVGMPNAGKSTLVAACSSAKPKIADYPFTTLEPVLGMVERNHRDFLLIEVPGLIEGAHMGGGLGLDFLRHAERTRILWHLVDGISDDVLDRIETVNHEVRSFSPELGAKPQILIINKMDVMEAQEGVARLAGKLVELGVEVFKVSAVTRKGLEPLIQKTLGMLADMPREQDAVPNRDLTEFRAGRRNGKPEVIKDGDVYEVTAPRAERIVAMVNMRDPRVRLQVWKELEKMGVDRALVKSGIKRGDIVRFGKVEMEWE